MSSFLECLVVKPIAKVYLQFPRMFDCKIRGKCIPVFDILRVNCCSGPGCFTNDAVS